MKATRRLGLLTQRKRLEIASNLMLRLRIFPALFANDVGKRFAMRPSFRYCSSFGTDLERWQRRCYRLAQLQRRIRFPPLQTLTVHGKTYELPLGSVEPLRSPSQEELEYLVGFFDGDGCVSMNKATGCIKLMIGQNVDSAEVLLHFRTLLGGSVGRHCASTGSRKAMVQWRVYGSKMTAASETLGRVPSMKQAQLTIAMRGVVANNNRVSVARHLQTFKQSHHVPDQWSECSWPYFAGFFDAEGAIMVHPTRAGLCLEVWQVNPCVLARLLHFLFECGLKAWSLHHRVSSSVLVCNKLPDIQQTLELLLANGLLVKRKQAELALTLSADNHLQVRDAISSLNGLQGRYKRLDSAGVARAREIRRLKDRLRKISGPEHATMLSQLHELRAEHKLQKLISRSDLLRKDMRQSLRQGGQVISTNIHSV